MLDVSKIKVLKEEIQKLIKFDDDKLEKLEKEKLAFTYESLFALNSKLVEIFNNYYCEVNPENTPTEVIELRRLYSDYLTSYESLKYILKVLILKI